MQRIRTLVALLFCAGLWQACAPFSRGEGPVARNALSAFVVWSAAPLEAGLALDGTPVDLVRVHGGQILRLEVTGGALLSVGERLPQSLAAAESWSSLTPVAGVVIFRPTSLTTAVLLPKGTVRRAQIGQGSDPGYAWFELEDQVIDWANGPLLADFPALAPAARLDRRAFAELDRELFAELERAGHPAPWLDAAHAIRRVAGLRVARALRPASGYPYFWDDRSRGSAAAQELRPGQSIALAVTGPAILHLWTVVPTDSDGAAEVRVLEGQRVRATTASTLPRLPLTHDDPAAPAAQAGRSLRRAIVQVPAGIHRYRIESTTHAFVTPLVARAVVHLEDAGEKSEEKAIETARATCGPGGSPALCAFALALAGEDAPPDARGGPSPYAEAFARCSPEARRMAEVLAAGGPRDPTDELEARGTAGDSAAIEALGRAALESSDERVRTAWSHVLARGTVWNVADTAAGEARWTGLATDRGGPVRTEEAVTWPELTSEERELGTSPWHGVPTVELVVVAPCDETTPVELVLDGERLTANPAAGQARWHVRVRGDTARARRVDGGRARVYALGPADLSAGRRFESIRAPLLASEVPSLSFGGEATLPGLELWLRDGAERAVLDVVRTTRGSEEQRARVVAPRANGPVAYDPSGARWTRIARVPLPHWASVGVRVSGDATVAVRALVRGPRATRGATPAPVEAPAVPLADPDEAMLSTLSRAILGATGDERAARYLERARALAAAGAGPGAFADAEAARALGARGPRGEDPVELVRASLRRRPFTVEPLPTSVNAYGVEPDFDPGARRCTPSTTGDRAAFATATEQVRSAAEGETPRSYDPVLAPRAVAAARRAPLDPRAPRVVAAALAGSRWRLRRDLEGDARHVPRGEAARHDGPIDGDGELRPRVLLGAPFAEGTYATISAEREARAVLDGLRRGTLVTLELVCAARDESRASGHPCPLEVSVDEQPQSPAFSPDGRARISLRWQGRRTSLVVRLRDDPGRWLAVARIVVDRAVPGSVAVDGSHWALAPPQLERRYFLRAGAELRLGSAAPTLFRVSALPASSEAVSLVLVGDGRERPLPLDGSPQVIPLPDGGQVALEARAGTVSLLVAERVPVTAAAPRDFPATAAQRRRDGPVPAVALDGGSGQSAAPPWLENAWRSPRPLTPLESSLGTVVAESDVDYGTIRSGGPAQTSPSAVLFTALGYRRRIESINLYTAFDLFARERTGEPTHGARAVLYEDLERWHLRLSQTTAFVTQRAAGIDARTWEARGFAEYSARLTHDLFVLPRLGYDGVYSSLPSRPSSAVEVDDEVYSPYRARRPTLLFAQGLLWYAPYFNEISYLRLRATIDPAIPAFAHVGARPGVLAVLGVLDVSTFADLVWHLPSDSQSQRASLSEALGTVARLDLWWGFGSLGVQPGVAGAWHVKDGGYQVSAFLNLLGSFRRGLRDYSSLELDFPEQRSGLIPWRGATPGGYR